MSIEEIREESEKILKFIPIKKWKGIDDNYSRLCRRREKGLTNGDTKAKLIKKMIATKVYILKEKINERYHYEMIKIILRLFTHTIEQIENMDHIFGNGRLEHILLNGSEYLAKICVYYCIMFERIKKRKGTPQQNYDYFHKKREIRQYEKQYSEHPYYLRKAMTCKNFFFKDDDIKEVRRILNYEAYKEICDIFTARNMETAVSGGKRKTII